MKLAIIDLDVFEPSIEDAKEALQTLRFKQHYCQLFLLTSRPESIREATVQWLLNQNILFYSQEGHVGFIMKPTAFQYTQTTVWKAGTIQMLVALYGADEVLVIDGEPANLAELAKYDTSHMRLCASLAEAVAPELDTSDHPF